MEIKLYQLVFIANNTDNNESIKYSRTIYLTVAAAWKDCKTAWDEVKSGGEYLCSSYVITIFVKYGFKDIFLRCLQNARGTEGLL